MWDVPSLYKVPSSPFLITWVLRIGLGLALLKWNPNQYRRAFYTGLNLIQYLRAFYTGCCTQQRERDRERKLKQSSNMKKQLAEQVIGIPISSASYPVDWSPKLSLLGPACQDHIPSPSIGSLTMKHGNVDSMTNRKNKLGKREDNFAHRVREHVRLGPKISETLKGKLSLGARILQLGGVEKVFKQLFSCREGEKLLNVSQCYLSTTAGPVAGLFFISIDKVAFCSERSIKVSSPKGSLIRVHYKATIPLRKIKTVRESENVKRPTQKYIELVTVDNFDFWFMGFLNFQKAFRNLQQAISQS